MPLNRYVLTSTVVVPAGTITTPVVAGEPGSGGAAGYGNTSTSAGAGYFPQTFIAGTAIVLDLTGPLYAAIGAGNLMAFRDGTDAIGHAATANLWSRT